MSTRTKVQEENLMAAQWLRTSAGQLNDRYLSIQAAGRDPVEFPVSGDLTARRRYLDNKRAKGVTK